MQFYYVHVTGPYLIDYFRSVYWGTIVPIEIVAAVLNVVIYLCCLSNDDLRRSARFVLKNFTPPRAMCMIIGKNSRIKNKNSRVFLDKKNLHDGYDDYFKRFWIIVFVNVLHVRKLIKCLSKALKVTKLQV